MIGSQFAFAEFPDLMIVNVSIHFYNHNPDGDLGVTEFEEVRDLGGNKNVLIGVDGPSKVANILICILKVIIASCRVQKGWWEGSMTRRAIC